MSALEQLHAVAWRLRAAGASNAEVASWTGCPERLVGVLVNGEHQPLARYRAVLARTSDELERARLRRANRVPSAIDLAELRRRPPRPARRLTLEDIFRHPPPTRPRSVGGHA